MTIKKSEFIFPNTEQAINFGKTKKIDDVYNKFIELTDINRRALIEALLAIFCNTQLYREMLMTYTKNPIHSELWQGGSFERIEVKTVNDLNVGDFVECTEYDNGEAEISSIHLIVRTASGGLALLPEYCIDKEDDITYLLNGGLNGKATINIIGNYLDTPELISKLQGLFTD